MEISRNKIIYFAATVVFIAIIVVIFFYSANFSFNKISVAFIVDTAKVEAVITKIDIEKFKTIGPKLGIDIQRLNL